MDKNLIGDNYAVFLVKEHRRNMALVDGEENENSSYMSAEDICETIYNHAENFKNPFADWFIELNRGNEYHLVNAYNKSNCNNVKDDLVSCFTLFDLFLLYVYYTKIHSHTPSCVNKVGIPWRQVKVDKVLDDFNKDIKSSMKMDKDSVLVGIFTDKLDKTTETICSNYDVEDVTNLLPKWVDPLDMSLQRYTMNRIENNPNYESKFITKDLVSFCRSTYDRWKNNKD